MDSSKSLTDNLDEFKKIVLEFKNLGEKLDDDNEAYVLLNFLPESYKEVKNALKYGRETITTDAIKSVLRIKEIKLQVIKREQSNAKGLFVKSKSKNNQHKNGKQQPNEEHKSKQKLGCNYCKKKGHIIKDCFILKRKNQEEKKETKGKHPEASIVESSYVYSDALASTQDQANQVSPLENMIGCLIPMHLSYDSF